MGAKIATYSFIAKPNEQIDAVICVEEEIRSMVFGVVKDSKGKLIKDAVVKLFRAKDCEGKCLLKPITHTFTDECGQFFFGPLVPGKKYVIKVWVNDVKVCRTEDNEDEWWNDENDSCGKDEDSSKSKAFVKDPNRPSNYVYR